MAKKGEFLRKVGEPVQDEAGIVGVEWAAQVAGKIADREGNGTPAVTRTLARPAHRIGQRL